jgi:hypothetical protein
MAAGSWAALVEAARLIDEVGPDDGVGPGPPDIPALQDDLRDLIAVAARHAAAREVEEGEAAGLPQAVIEAADGLVAQGDGLLAEAKAQDSEQKLVDAIAAYREAYEMLAPLLHPAANEGTRGDVDCDGDRDAVDALHILRQVAGLTPAADCLFNGDLDCSLELSAVDALLGLRRVAGLPLSLREGCPAP